MQKTATTPGMDTDAATAAHDGRKPAVLQKRIDSTIYLVNVRFPQESRETLEEKILRLIESEVRNSA